MNGDSCFQRGLINALMKHLQKSILSLPFFISSGIVSQEHVNEIAGMERSLVLKDLNQLDSQLFAKEQTNRNYPVQEVAAPVNADVDPIERNGADSGEGDGRSMGTDRAVAAHASTLGSSVPEEVRVAAAGEEEENSSMITMPTALLSARTLPTADSTKEDTE